jgi:hypothetical protein
VIWVAGICRSCGEREDQRLRAAMNYGYHTPLTTIAGQIVYGATLGGFMELQQVLVPSVEPRLFSPLFRSGSAVTSKNKP